MHAHTRVVTAANFEYIGRFIVQQHCCTSHFRPTPDNKLSTRVVLNLQITYDRACARVNSRGQFVFPPCRIRRLMSIGHRSHNTELNRCISLDRRRFCSVHALPDRLLFDSIDIAVAPLQTPRSARVLHTVTARYYFTGIDAQTHGKRGSAATGKKIGNISPLSVVVVVEFIICKNGRFKFLGHSKQGGGTVSRHDKCLSQ